jgi:DNA recombination protein RmuC
MTATVVTIVLLLLLLLVTIANIWITLKKDGGNDGEVLTKLTKTDADITRIDPLIRDEFGRNRNETLNALRENREELSHSFKLLSDTLSQKVTDLSVAQNDRFDSYSLRLSDLSKSFDEKTKSLQEQLEKSAKDNRTEQASSLKSFEDKFAQNVKDFNELQKQKFDDLVNKQENIRKEVEGKLTSIREENGKKLDDMRKIVDEKLQESITKRFNESFELISKRLEEVQKGLGEMQTLASDVGGLKKVLSTVHTRGALGEIELATLLSQILSPEYYGTQASVKENTQERVDAVVKLPGQTDDRSELLLPIDAKFNTDDYLRLHAAYESYEAGESKKPIQELRDKFAASVKKAAKSIAEKYINPPLTTDFAIMFVPSEGIYAEILRCTGLFESLRKEGITVVGPTNLAAFLSSLKMGFRTLAISKRTSEVWTLLGAVKTEFGKFGTVLDKASSQLQTVANSISSAGVRTRAIERKLRSVESLPQEQSTVLLGEVIELEQDNIISDNDEAE